MKVLEELIASLRRFLGFRTASPAESTDGATEDRPPPVIDAPAAQTTAVETPDVQTADVELTSVAISDADTTAAETTTADAPAISEVADQVAEIRALLEAMAEPLAQTQTADEVADISAHTPTVEIPSQTPVAEVPPPTQAVDNEAPIAPAGTLVLTLLAPPTTFTIAKSGATLGRGEDNAIRLDDLSVSRRHARIAYRQGGYWLSDLGSMGGTWIGEARLDAAQRIQDGDVIDIGHYRLTASLAGEPHASTPETRPATPKRRPSRAR